MGDNTQTNVGTGGDLIATDALATINGVAASGEKVQRVKVGFGPDGDFRDADATHGLPVTLATGDPLLTLAGAVTEAPPASDTASSGLNGRLQRLAQRLTSLIALLPATIGQKAKAASLAVTLASDDDLLAKIGEVQVSPTANTLLDRLKQLLTAASAATPAGEAHIGAVGGNSVVVGGSFSRPADTTAYNIGDLVANNTVAGSVVPIPCAVARVTGGSGVARRVRLSTNKTGLVGTESFRVHFFKTIPTVTGGDNAALAVNGIASIALGYVDITMSAIYSDGAKGFTSTDIVYDAAGGSQNIYGLIEARSAYSPASGETFTLAVEALQD
jgi:hypothetical protein